jgi:DivIVA domain-containing protein
MAANKRQTDGTEIAAPPVQDEGLDELRDHVPADIRNVSFSVSVRGYDRDAVDAYVKRVNRVIAELEVSRSPQAAVRHALDRVGKQTIAVLQEARESADKLMEAAREEADEAKDHAKAEAAKLVVNVSAEADRTKADAEQLLADTRAKASDILNKARAESANRVKEAEEEIAALQERAETRMREIQADTQVVLKERSALLDETHAMASRLQEIASGAAARLPSQKTAAAENVAEDAQEPTPEPGAAAEAEPTAVRAYGQRRRPRTPSR